MATEKQTEALNKRSNDLDERSDALDRRAAGLEKTVNRRGRQTKRERQRKANVAGWKRRNHQSTAIKLARNVAFAEIKLKELKELAGVLKPFLQNAAIMLGKEFDELMNEEILLARSGIQMRVLLDDDGEPVVGKDGTAMMERVLVSPAQQIAARKYLITMFPKLIPEESKSMDRDPLLSLHAVLKEGGGGRMALEVNGAKEEHEPDEEIIEGVGRILNDDDEPTVIDTDSQNA